MSGAVRPRQRGIILVAVLLAVAIMSVMVVAATALTRAGAGTEQLEQRRLASHLALRSGLEAAKALILATPEQKRVLLDGEAMPVDLGNGVSATVTLRDAAGYVDLNRTDPKIIEAVARFSGVGKSADGLADRITKLRVAVEPALAAVAAKPAATSKAGAVPGGSAASPALNKPKQLPPPIIFVSVEQVPDLLGIPADEAGALGAGLTVFNPTGEINPFAAPEQVLQAIPGLSDRDAADIARARKAGTGAEDARLQQLMQRLPGVLTMKPPRVFVVEVKLDGGPAILPGSAARAVVRLMSEGQSPFGTLALEEE